GLYGEGDAVGVLVAVLAIAADELTGPVLVARRGNQLCVDLEYGVTTHLGSLQERLAVAPIVTGPPRGLTHAVVGAVAALARAYEQVICGVAVAIDHHDVVGLIIIAHLGQRGHVVG